MLEPTQVFEIFMAAGGGSVITLMANKIVSLKKEKQELQKGSQEIIVAQQTYLETINDQLNETIKQLQDVACYTPNCKTRTNGIGEVLLPNGTPTKRTIKK